MKYIVIILFMALFLISGIEHDAQAQQNKVQIVNLSNGEAEENFYSIRRVFKEQNPGYDMTYLSGVQQVEAQDYTQVVFVQEIEGITNQDVEAQATVIGNSDSQEESEAIVGDIFILNGGEMMQSDVEMGLLVFKVPEEPGSDLPSFIRPDWDPNITDVPGGCATDIDAYRRILLTWQKDVGEYIYHALNAHRVRIYDSFSHYHPKEGGFDEFYLVQMVKPGAKIITSERVEKITRPGEVKKSEVDKLVREYELEVGDLVYLPRGVMHRGLDGVLAQVITVPGFIPGSEIGVDHHLRAINERLNLEGEEALPYNEEHSDEAVIR
ncbi:hypothetical protein LQ318_12845 [Aliifodinibius salicampi]|uniref:JmjC domain-containing protein n=2 Tax=Fodinibius salicampi TaxID=1920655 RepID=A0ABT3Q0Z5_9BACT|nr:hypothetical protein [Fodinibius salicampi]MCW9713792.1 hypothetical protein [Fodinibius salicampi]